MFTRSRLKVRVTGLRFFCISVRRRRRRFISDTTIHRNARTEHKVRRLIYKRNTKALEYL